MQPPPAPSLLSNFFSSLRQVEKRLKLDHQPPPPPPTRAPPRLLPPPPESQTQELEIPSKGSLSSPLFLHIDQPIVNPSADLDSSEPPRAFLSVSQDFRLTDQDPPQASPSDRHRCVNDEPEDGESDEIERLMELLGLPEEEEEQGEDGDGNDCNSCHCEGGFYSKIVGVKGPKCRKEMKRLDGWIKHFREEKKEPLRLAYLLLGKTAFLSESADAGFAGLEFPSTIQEFLHNDPPSSL